MFGWPYADRLAAIESELRAIRRTLDVLTEQGVSLMAAMDDLETKVEAMHGAVESASLLLAELAKELRDAMASGDPARLEAVVAGLEADRQKLADAVAANPDPNP